MKLAGKVTERMAWVNNGRVTYADPTYPQATHWIQINIPHCTLHPILDEKATNRPPGKRVLLDAGSVNFIDTSACDALLNSIKKLQSQGITFAFARVRDPVRERMRLGCIEAVVGSASFHERVTDGVLAWQQQEKLDAVSAGHRTSRSR